MWKREDVAISVPQWVLWTVLAAPLVSFMLSLSAFPAPFFIEDAVVKGYADPRFASIRRLFKQNFDEGLEREGANVAVYHGGRLVVNLWAGYADSEADRPWKANTRSVLFSTTKAMASVCIGMLVDRGYLSYDDLVVKYWPAYGQNGKNSTTIEHVLTHQAGLPYLEEPVTMEDVRQVQPLLRKIERSSPQWQPGDYTGYHAITFGFIVDGIMRHVDPKGRDLKTFFREEVAEPYGLDLDIGVPKSESHKLARITLPGILEFIRDTVRDPRILGMLALMHIRPSDTHLHRLIANPDWVVINYDTVSVNDPEVLELPLGSVTGVGNAANLAKLFGLVLDGTLLSNSTLELMREPTLNDWHLERITVYPLMKGRGFFYDAHPVLSGKYVFGHPGYGGQMLIVDPENDLVIAYVANGLKTGSSVLCRGPQRLLHEVYRVLYSM